MKKVFIVLMMALMSLGTQAQSVKSPGEKYPVYCTI